MISLIPTHENRVHIGHVRINAAIVKSLDIKFITVILGSLDDFHVGIGCHSPPLRIKLRREKRCSVTVDHTGKVRIAVHKRAGGKGEQTGTDGKAHHGCGTTILVCLLV